MKRKGIPQKIRFEIFKRDSFTCQYCGREAPKVTLNVDHINPVKNGGDNDITNLITSCFDCNIGKSARLLDDNHVVKKQKKSLNELQERRNQIEMIAQWREDLLNVNDLKINKLCDFILKGWNYKLDIEKKRKLQTISNKFELNIVYDAIERAFDHYSDTPCEDAKSYAFSKIGGICYNMTNDVRNEFNLLYEKADIIFDEIEKYGNPVFKWQRGVTISLLKKMNKLYSVDEMKFIYDGGWFCDWDEWREAVEKEIKSGKKIPKVSLSFMNQNLETPDEDKYYPHLKDGEYTGNYYDYNNNIVDKHGNILGKLK
tara:strand:+ start:45 stop:986 length:942 start_codon:yes stop_codon:yes gene_type:complete